MPKSQNDTNSNLIFMADDGVVNASKNNKTKIHF